MRLTEANIESFKELKSYKPGKAQAIVKEFIDSGKAVMKVEVGENEYSDKYSATSTLNAAIATMKVSSTVKATTKNGETYIYNPQMIDE